MGNMNTFLVFDCYQTLLYKKNLEKIVREFIAKKLGAHVPLPQVKSAFDLIYYRHKFAHPRFSSPQDRKKFFITYNRELLRIMGFDISDTLAADLNTRLNRAVYAPYPDTVRALKYFKTKKKIPLGLLANWTASLETVLKNLHMDKYFDSIMSSHNLKIEKPDPEFFTRALIIIKKKYKKIYYVGDDYELDILPARAAGLIPILIDRKNKYPAQIDCIKIRSLVELSRII